MLEQEQINKKLRNKRRLKKLFHIRSLVILLTLLVTNSFAWFLYSSQSDMKVHVHVDSWKINFSDENKVQSEKFEINFDPIYPGVAEQKRTFTIENKGERAATVGYIIEEARIFDDDYKLKEDGADTGYTADEIKDILDNNYPFKFTFTTEYTSGETELGTGKNCTFSVALNWAYNNGDDKNDTEIGLKAYDYYNNYTNSNDSDLKNYPVYLKIRLIATQVESDNSSGT